MPTAERIAIIGAAPGAGPALAVLRMCITAQLEPRYGEAGAHRREFETEAAQDRRALPTSMDRVRGAMDTFRTARQRLAERQWRVERWRRRPVAGTMMDDPEPGEGAER